MYVIGVAYNTVAHGNDMVRWVQRWPGRTSQNENKVPTMLLYPHAQDLPTAWGFRAESQSQQIQDHGAAREWFKTLLDPENFAREKDRYPFEYQNHLDVRQWFRDYLRLLYGHLRTTLSSEVPNFNWNLAKIEFLFSVPTTWSPAIVEQYKSLVTEAGFGGAAYSSHSVTVSLTEPEAAAVYTSTHAAGIFKDGDILVVCDAGGGTTDLSALKVTDGAAGALSLKQLKQLETVSGENVGSAAIDYGFELLARARLTEARSLVGLEVDGENAAWAMAKSLDFQNTKCEHGAPDETPTFSIAVPGLPPDYCDADSGIEHREMLFRRYMPCTSTLQTANVT